jgi:hypothetical protein
MTLSDKEALRIIVDPARRLLAGPAVAGRMPVADRAKA